MISLDYGTLEELEVRLKPILERRGLEVESIQAIGLLGRGGSGSVFSLLINHRYHVIKLYVSHDAYLREMRNFRRLISPPRVVLSSAHNRNSLGYSLIITEVPQGVSFNSTHLSDWVCEHLGNHLIELHRIRRTRRVTVQSLRQAVSDVEWGAGQAARKMGPDYVEMVETIIAEMKQFLEKNAAIMRQPLSLLHNDLWWDNIIIAGDDVYLIDWEWVRLGDYLEDLAYSRTMTDFVPAYNVDRKFWVGDRDPADVDRFFAGIIEMYRNQFDDETISERFRFYLALQSLRRLSDYAESSHPTGSELVHNWLEELPKFWQRGVSAE